MSWISIQFRRHRILDAAARATKDGFPRERDAQDWLKKNVLGRKEMVVSIADGRRNPHLDLRLPGIAVSDAETVGWGLAHSVYGLV